MEPTDAADPPRRVGRRAGAPVVRPSDAGRNGTVDPSPSHHRDERVRALLRRVAAGDEDAFAQLYDTVAPRIFGLAARVTADREIAAEVVQEVMLEVWRTAPRYDAARGSGVGWLLMLTHRRAVDRVRSSAARRSREERVGAERTVAPEVDDDLVRRGEHDAVRDALRDLPERQREAIALAYYGGHTYREVAELLDVPEGTAKSRLRDGIRRLRGHLGGGS